MQNQHFSSLFEPPKAAWRINMRLRNVKGSQERILENPYTIQTDGTNGDDYKGLWNKNIFHNNHPIHIEIGMGKGQFITTLAKENPDINFIGIEKYSSVLVRALDKREELETNNLIFVRMDAEDLTSYFAEGEISKVYLNFSDPWPKDRHAKRRLTSVNFLARYDNILQADGLLQFKTDNRPLFDFSLEQLNEAGWMLDESTFDLHKNGPAPNNIMTEYEEKFYAMGNPICRFTAHR
jgi:tRNA (guanine-N7-)-methyltransferase